MKKVVLGIFLAVCLIFTSCVTTKVARLVSLKFPYPKVYKSQSVKKISVQYAVMDMCRQVGLQYDWDTSQENTAPDCKKIIKPTISNIPFSEAMTDILEPLGLTYTVDWNVVALHRNVEKQTKNE